MNAAMNDERAPATLQALASGADPGVKEPMAAVSR